MPSSIYRQDLVQRRDAQPSASRRWIVFVVRWGGDTWQGGWLFKRHVARRLRLNNCDDVIDDVIADVALFMTSLLASLMTWRWCGTDVATRGDGDCRDRRISTRVSSWLADDDMARHVAILTCWLADVTDDMETRRLTRGTRGDDDCRHRWMLTRGMAHVSRSAVMVTRGTAHFSKVKLFSDSDLWTRRTLALSAHPGRRDAQVFSVATPKLPFCPFSSNLSSIVHFAPNLSPMLPKLYLSAKQHKNTSKRSQNSRNYTKY